MNDSLFPAAYFDTRFHLEAAPGLLPERFAIITAYNPMNQRWSPRMNRRADHRLKRLLDRKLIDSFRVTGSSPDGRHAEPGWGVVCDLDEALSIARRYRQYALWWVEADELSLIHHTGDPEVAVGSYSGRVD